MVNSSCSRPPVGRFSLSRWLILILPLAALAVLVTYLAVDTALFASIITLINLYSPLIIAIDLGQSVLLALGYPGLALIIFIEHVFPPAPTDVILPLAGYTAATTTMTLAGAMVATTFGSLAGSLVLYYAGYLLGEERVRTLARRWGKYVTFEEDELERSLHWFRRHGSVVVMVARVVPVFRSLISIPAGMSRMPLGRFLIFTAIGAGAWNSGLISAGYALGSNWDLVVGWLDKYQYAMLAVNTALVVTIVTWRVRNVRRRLKPPEPGTADTGEPSERGAGDRGDATQT